MVVLMMSFASAEFWTCFEKGERAEYCGDYRSSTTCGSSFGCTWCMSSYDEARDCYIHGVWPVCNQVTPDCEFTGSGTIDSEPPIFNLLKPMEDELYTSRKVLVEFSLDERADVYFLDLINGRGRWKRVCSKCDAGNPSYSRTASFKEGYNKITFRAVDVVGNEAFENVSFFVDSKKPKITRTEPRRGFSDGNFHVQFKEDNPKALKLYYGNDAHILDIEEDCYMKRTKYYCDVSVNVEDYDGEEIEYWFTLEDRAGNIDESRIYDLEVDTTFPVIVNSEDFWTVDDRYIYFNMEIDEENFDEVTYTYFDSRGKPRERRLCSRLKDGICEKKKRFKEGHHEITISVWDDAGNVIGQGIEFDIIDE